MCAEPSWTRVCARARAYYLYVVYSYDKFIFFYWILFHCPNYTYRSSNLDRLIRQTVHTVISWYYYEWRARNRIREWENNLYIESQRLQTYKHKLRNLIYYVFLDTRNESTYSAKRAYVEIDGNKTWQKYKNFSVIFSFFLN